MRISIIGLPGSGKSTLARAISKKLGIPHIHLDRFWFSANGHTLKPWEAGKREMVRAEVRHHALEATSAESWVSDGFYYRLQKEIAPLVDILVHLDIPFWERIANHATRTFGPRKRYPEVSFVDDLLFFFELVRRTFATGPKLRRFVQEYPGRLVVLRTRKEIEAFLNNLA